MKSFLIFVLLVGGAGIWFYLHPLRPRESAAANSPLPAVAAPHPRRVAPPGTLYLLQYVSVRTPKGVYGLEPGSPVQVIKTDTPAGTVLVSDGTHQTSVQTDQVTDDLDLAAQARNADQAQQSEIVARQRADLLRTQAMNTASVLVQDAAKQEAAAPRITLVGRVVEKVSGGLIVHCEPFRPVASGMASIGGGGGVSMPMGNESEVFGDFFVKGHPGAAALVDGDRVDVKVIAAGQHRDEDGQTLRAYKVVP